MTLLGGFSTAPSRLHYLRIPEQCRRDARAPRGKYIKRFGTLTHAHIKSLIP